MVRALDVARWAPWLRERAGSVAPADEPLTPTFPRVQLQFQVQIAVGANVNAAPDSWNWTNVTRFVFLDPGMTITRGRRDSQTQAPPSTLSLTLRNFDPADPTLDALFSPRNPASPFYGIGRNTPIKVDVNPGTGWYRRFTGFVSNWPPQWDITGRMKFVVVQADGILRRLGQGTSPLKSSMRHSAAGQPDMVAYWPLEDGSGATQFAPYLPTGVAATASGTITRAADSSAAGSTPLPTFGNDAYLSVAYSSSVVQSNWRAGWMAMIPAAPATTVLLADVTATGGSVTRWRFTVVPGGSSVNVDVQGYNAAGVSVFGPAILGIFSNTLFYGVPIYYRFAVAPSPTVAGQLDIALGMQSAGLTSGAGSGLAASTGGSLTGIVKPVETNLPSMVLGHLTLGINGFAIASDAVQFSGAGDSGITGHNNEAPTTRFPRLCTESGFTSTLVGVSSQNNMGPQPIASLLAALSEVEAVENGVMAETTGGQLALYARALFENRSASLTMDYLLGHVAPPFQPIEDDQQVRNDVTASRPSGSFFHATADTDSPLYVGDATHPGVGLYDTSVTTNVVTDSLLAAQASYRVTHGTATDARYQITVNLARSPELILAWLACDIGSRITVLNTPVDDGPDVVEQSLQGYSETLTPFGWRASLNCTPFWPNRIFRVAAAVGDANEFLGYVVPTTCVLAAGTDTTQTTVSITSSTLWATSADDWAPAVPVAVGGEVMLVSGVSGAANPQTLTVTRSANGIAKTHSTNDALTFVNPGVLGL